MDLAQSQIPTVLNGLIRLVFWSLFVSPWYIRSCWGLEWMSRALDVSLKSTTCHDWDESLCLSGPIPQSSSAIVSQELRSFSIYVSLPASESGVTITSACDSPFQVVNLCFSSSFVFNDSLISTLFWATLSASFAPLHSWLHLPPPFPHHSSWHVIQAFPFADV
jgi:hypothetical protein